MRFILFISCVVLLFSACKKSNKDNPYDDWKSDTKAPVVPDKTIDPNSIQGLHKNIFKPTCSNSGCHDGNFEPDFRTVESSYNSLINRLTTNTDPNNPQFSKRVVPADVAKSMLIHRLSTFIPGSQGIMPLSVDPGSDWNDKKNEYIQNIRNWINDGAKDQFGKSPSDIDFSPQLGGMIVFADGSATPLARSAYSPVQIPGGTSTITIMFAYTDDKTPVNQFGTSTINFTLNPYQFDSTFQNLYVESNAVTYAGITGSNVNFWHSFTVNVSDLGVSGDVIWIRTETTDKVNNPVFIPGASASFNFFKHCAIKIN